MAHAVVEKQKLLNRVRPLGGQVDAIERALIADEGCGDLMRLITATRGATNGIMAEVVNGHIQTSIRRMKSDFAVEFRHLWLHFQKVRLV